MTQTIMLMGTSSHVGKSILTTALCRIFHQQGRRVAPFKAQNMALNSFVTCEGLEMGRAQVAQAEAAGLRPVVAMNPVLLKPTGEAQSQVIINGRPIGNMSARDYHLGHKEQAWAAVTAALQALAAQYDTLVIEGAGSPAEVNLRAGDIVNMRVARHLQAPVLLVADIDRGGALAALVGTLELLEPEERALVKGLVINKFRGDVSLFTPAIDFLEQKTGKPVLGVVPYISDLGIEEEDSVTLEERAACTQGREEAALSIAVLNLPKLSNFTDLDALADEPDVSLHYVATAAELAAGVNGRPWALVILPGSKNTSEDLLWLRAQGLADVLQQLHAQGVPLIGICGGYQMLGQELRDPLQVESAQGTVQGLGYLPAVTTFTGEKLTVQVRADCAALSFAGQTLTAQGLMGYEIHMGTTAFTEDIVQPFYVQQADGRQTVDGAVTAEGLVLGTYMHGLFDDDVFRRQLLNALRVRRGLPALPPQRNRQREKEAAYDRLAGIVRTHLDMAQLVRIMAQGGGR